MNPVRGKRIKRFLFLLTVLVLSSAESLLNVKSETVESVEARVPLEMGVFVDAFSEVLDYAVKVYAVTYKKLPYTEKELRRVMVVDFNSPLTGEPFAPGEIGGYSLEKGEGGALVLTCWRWESVAEDGKRLVFEKLRRTYTLHPKSKYLPAVSFSWLLESTMRAAEVWWELSERKDVADLRGMLESVGCVGGGFERVPGGRKFRVEEEKERREIEPSVSLAKKLWLKLKGPSWIWGKNEKELWVRYLIDENGDFVISRYFVFPLKESDEKEKQ